MADNVGYTPGAGATIAADEVAGVLYQRVKPAFGADGAAVDVSSANPLPITAPTPLDVAVGGVVDVSVTGTPSVSISGTPAVSVSGTASVNVANTPSVNVANSPSVSVANSPAVVLSDDILESLEASRRLLQSLTRSVGQAMPDNAGRLRVLVDSITASLTLTTVSTVSTVANQTSIGGLSGTEQIPSLMRIAADSLRRNITVT